ncbi:hypothetical protein [Microbacterium murale]|uniref:hypothetical protein n=1 Tax=Microbacterium murale TaxID=1081040 RepID=UPI0027D906F2|nr:hypothetical protein [Microbacterium murale]
MIAAVLAIGVTLYLVHLFRRDHRIRTRGRRVRARVEDVRHVTSADTGAVTIRYRLSWIENGVTKRVEGRETILAKRVAEVQRGREVDIIYVDDDHIQFEFE